MDDILKRLSNENEEECLYRIGSKKDILDMTWQQIADWMNEEFRESETEYRTESAYRKKFKAYADAKNMFAKQQAESEGTSNEYAVKMRELEKQKIKLRDERIDYQKSIREDARKESFIELIERAMEKTIEPFDYNPSPIIDSNEDMIVCLSDLHAGIEVQNWWNTFNTDILKQRLHKYLNEIISIQNLHQCKVCNVVLGGDNISGIIHPNLRLQNNENVIEQLKIAITYIGEFINVLKDYFETINVYSVSGNHSRISPNKEDHLNGEELDAMIPFCLSLQFIDNKNVIIENDNRIDNSIGNFTTRGGKLFYIIHGDKDTPTNAVKNLTLMTGKRPDGIIMGHRHHTAYDTDHNVKLVQCGCIVGMDDYCVDKRISGEPEQCVLITSENRTVKCLYDIGLN